MLRKYIPPNTGALCFFLKNRMSDRWREKIEVSTDPESDPLMLLAISIKDFQIEQSKAAVLPEANEDS